MSFATMIAASFLQGFLPADYAPMTSIEVDVDKRPAVLSRAERRDAENAGLSGEHISTLEADDTLLGYVGRILWSAISIQIKPQYDCTIAFL